jgi:hypothetical protein
VLAQIWTARYRLLDSSIDPTACICGLVLALMVIVAGWAAPSSRYGEFDTKAVPDQ